MSATKVIGIVSVLILIFLPRFDFVPLGAKVQLDYEKNGRLFLEYGNKFQGDIVLTPSQEKMFNGTETSAKTGLKNEKYRWPRNSAGQVIVPYSFKASDGFTQAQKNIISEGLQEIESKTCVKFVPRTFQADYVEVINDSGCYSYLGRIGGKQKVSLEHNACVNKGTVMHEFIHVLGYDHMHNHFDRDSFVKIQIENVRSNERSNFDKVDFSFFNYGTSYDLLSIMHYSKNAFSSNGKDTIVPVDKSYLNRIGSKELSPNDVTRINHMYQCKEKTDRPNKVTSSIFNWLDQLRESLTGFVKKIFRL